MTKFETLEAWFDNDDEYDDDDDGGVIVLIVLIACILAKPERNYSINSCRKQDGKMKRQRDKSNIDKMNGKHC